MDPKTMKRISSMLSRTLGENRPFFLVIAEAVPGSKNELAVSSLNNFTSSENLKNAGSGALNQAISNLQQKTGG